MCKVSSISGKNDNNSRFLQVFLIFGQGGAVAIGPIGPMGLMGLMGIPLREQRLGSMVVALRGQRLAASSRLTYWAYWAYWAYSPHWAAGWPLRDEVEAGGGSGDGGVEPAVEVE